MDIGLLAERVDGSPPPTVDVILDWIGFERATTRERIQEEGFDTFANLATLKEKDIHDLAESYSRQTVGNDRAIWIPTHSIHDRINSLGAGFQPHR